MDKLREGRVKPSGHGIGLLNIDNRIKLTYGEAFGLFLYNDGDMAAGKGTFAVPRSRIGDKYV